MGNCPHVCMFNSFLLKQRSLQRDFSSTSVCFFFIKALSKQLISMIFHCLPKPLIILICFYCPHKQKISVFKTLPLTPTVYRHPKRNISLQQNNTTALLRTVPTIVTVHINILCILRYSDFLWVVPTNTGVFLRCLKLCGESRT